MGVAGLALANSAAVTIEIVIAYEALRRRLGGVHTRRLLTGLGQIAIASTAMGAVLVLGLAGPAEGLATTVMGRFGYADRGGDLLVRVASLAMVSCAGGLTYVATAWALSFDELREGWRRISARLTWHRRRL
jgi:hypothetical protein